MDTTLKSTAERVYALDALRAIMMLLGLVIHAAITYGAKDYKTAWSLKDPSNSAFFDTVVSFIHVFRMPVFFVAAGFFAALLLHKKGSTGMLTNRVKRILLPFMAGVLLVYPLVVFAFIFTRTAFAGVGSPLSVATERLVSGQFLPFRVVHLWFLYFLILYVFVGWLFARLFSKDSPVSRAVRQLCAFIFQRFWLRLTVLTCLLFLSLYWMGGIFIKTNTQWSIDPAIFFTYLVCFGAGWQIYCTNSLTLLKSYPGWQLGLALLLFLASTYANWPSEPWVLPAKQALAALYSTLFIFGFIAFFLTYFNSYSPRLNYIMESAYWVYIIHLPVVAFIPGLLAGFAAPAFVKFAITLSVTGIFCFVTYAWLVRGSFIGLFLNGKVHRHKKQAAKQELALK